MSVIDSRNFAKSKLKFHFYGQNSDGPCEGLGSFFEGQLNDLNSLKEFANTVDILTLENEFINSSYLKNVEQNYSNYTEC